MNRFLQVVNSFNPSKVVMIMLMIIVPLSDAYAYVDPGSGMLLWQGLIAAIGGVILFIRNPILAIRSLLKRLFGK